MDFKSEQFIEGSTGDGFNRLTGNASAQKRGGCLAQETASAFKTDVLQQSVGNEQFEQHFVAARGVRLPAGVRGGRQSPPPGGMPGLFKQVDVFERSQESHDDSLPCLQAVEIQFIYQVAGQSG